MKVLAWASLVLLLALVTATLQAAPAAATYVVNDATDLPGVPPLTDGHCAATNGKCTLRAAVMEANHTPGSATIILPAGTYSLTIPAAGPDDETTGDLNISTTVVSIQGAGASSTIIGAGADAGRDDARRAGLAEDAVEAPFAPEGEQAAGVAAADVDDVVVEDKAFQVGGGQVEEGEVRG
jgi:hypothetical protein